MGRLVVTRPEFRLITGAPDNVVAAQQWCKANPGTEIRFADGWYRAVRGTDEDSAVVMMGGYEAVSQPFRTTESSDRGFWKKYRALMGA